MSNGVIEGPAVVGAGIVGVCTALYLQRRGQSVTLYDPGGPAAGASYGNAGLISPESCVPIAMPGILRKLPGWLLDPEGPLAIDRRYLPRAAPWLLRLMRAGRRSQVLRIAKALRALHAPAFEAYRDLLGDRTFEELIRVSGHVQIWNGDAGSELAPLVREIFEANDVRAEPLGADDLRQLVPDLAKNVAGGLLLPNNGMTLNPRRLVETLCDIFVAAGGTLRREKVMKLVPEDTRRIRVLANQGDRRHEAVVVAAGAWSRGLLRSLGLVPPLDTERGYHAMIEDPGLDLRIPVLHKGLGFGATPMEHGLRLAGTVEFAGLSAPPNEKRARKLLEHGCRLFPKLQTSKISMWMGFRPSMPDSLPVIDTVPSHPGIFMGFGHGHFGMTGGPTTARALARLMTGERPGLDLAPYALSRF